MAYDAVGAILILGQKLFGAGECYLIDVFVEIIGIHAYTAVADGECAGFLIHCHADIECAQFALELAEARERAQFLCGVHSVADELAQKYFMVAIQELLDYRENVFGGNTDFAFLHIVEFFMFLITQQSIQKKCHIGNVTFFHKYF